jgi:tetratricopeptide (TPR) repeat protein
MRDDTRGYWARPRIVAPAAALLVTAWLVGCVTPARLPPVSENQAVLSLADGARADAEAGRFATAAASLERALRIESKNPMLWQQLAQLHMKRSDYVQAETLAARSNSWAGTNRALRAANWQLIGEARARRGDAPAAQAAYEKAKEYE